MNNIEPSDNFIIDGINYGCLVKIIEKKAFFHDCQQWEDMLNSILIAMSNMKMEIIETSQETEKKRRKYKGLGNDRPTDTYWVLSILFTLRTMGMLYSKSTNPNRSCENHMAHNQLLERYVSILQELYKRKKELIAIFPHSRSR